MKSSVGGLYRNLRHKHVPFIRLRGAYGRCDEVDCRSAIRHRLSYEVWADGRDTKLMDIEEGLCETHWRVRMRCLEDI